MEALAVARSGVPESTAAYARLVRLVHKATGVDLEPYKGRFIERRIDIRIRATRHHSLESYVEQLARDGEEMERLLRCLTIHVSSFFRNASTFEAIRREVFPQLFAPGGSRKRRFWSVGCARGEEPYSLAILALEHLGVGRRGWDVRIDAVDIDNRVLEAAKRGEYGWPQVASLDPGLRERYFTQEGHWRVVPEVRRMVRFSRGDILMEQPFGDYDFVLCRNLLIYLDRRGQEAVMERFSRALRPGGFLVLGRTEVLVGGERGGFEVVDSRERVYRRLGAGVASPAPASAHGGRA